METNKEPPGIVNVVDLFPGERTALVELLSGLTPEQWFLPTVCEGWSVHDIALHLLGGDVNILSGGRDGFRGPPNQPRPGNLDTWDSLVDFINARNGIWVDALRRMSPRLLCDLLAHLGEPTAAHFASQDLLAPGPTVDWVGPGPHPSWMHIAREYTERWVHQQQIRDAVDQPGLTGRIWMFPVLDMFARALPHALRDTAAPEGSAVTLDITGDAGGSWAATRLSGRWRLTGDAIGDRVAEVRLPASLAWRLFTKGVTPDQVQDDATVSGDRALTDAVLNLISVIA